MGYMGLSRLLSNRCMCIVYPCWDTVYTSSFLCISRHCNCTLITNIEMLSKLGCVVCPQDQYVFIHDAILESVTCGDTQISAGDLRKQIQRLSQVVQNKSCTGFQFQFQILKQVTPSPDQISCSTAQSHPTKNRGIMYLPGEGVLSFKSDDPLPNASAVENQRVYLKGENPENNYINAVFANVSYALPD